jgi:hypothetical protein
VERGLIGATGLGAVHTVFNGNSSARVAGGVDAQCRPQI